MRKGLFAMIAGLFCGSYLPTLLPAFLVISLVLLPVLCVLPARHLSIRVLISLFVVGVVWSQWHGQRLYQNTVIAMQGVAGQTLLVQGRVRGLPETTSGSRAIIRFDLEVIEIKGKKNSLLEKQRLRLAWYHSSREPLLESGLERFEPGQIWQLQLRLKPLRGLSNPGGFDYHGWLLREGYSARGYVVNSTLNQRLPYEPVTDMGGYFERWRYTLQQHLADSGLSDTSRVVVQALLLGDKSGLERHHWKTLQATGTHHLLVVSGLHIGLVATLAFMVGSLLSRLLWLPLKVWPAPLWGGVCSALSAWAYSGLTGFSLPTQRALVMVLAVLLALLWRRTVPVSVAYLAAICVVLLLDPLAGFSASFWLSFGAAGLLLYGFSGRVPFRVDNRSITWRGLWLKWGQAQWLISVGLLPALLFWNGETSIAAPLANILAVPYVSLLLLPLVFVCGVVVTLSGSNEFGLWVILLTDHAVQRLWQLLLWFEQWPVVFTFGQSATLWIPATVLAAIGVLILLSPRALWPHWCFRPAGKSPKGVPLNIFPALCLLLPLLFATEEKLPPGQLRLTIVDVGQGLAVLMETTSHVVIYDVGERFSDNFDTGRDVLAPLLKRRNHKQIDTLVISHRDRDHAGGFAGLLEEVSVKRIISGDAAWLNKQSHHERNDYPWVQYCYRGQSWQYDGVVFEMLSPTALLPLARETNNRSCVLKVSGKDWSVLLPGDIESIEERRLLRQLSPANVQADILIVPHHGSASSSSAAFLAAVQPQHAIVSAGYRNRFGHPRPEVLARYREKQIQVWRTDYHGALIVSSDENGEPAVAGQRTRALAYWQRW